MMHNNVDDKLSSRINFLKIAKEPLAMFYHTARITLLAVSALFLWLSVCHAQAPIDASANDLQHTTQDHAKDNVPDLAMMIAFMKPDTEVLRVGDMALRWQELQPLVKEMLQPQRKTSSEDQTLKLRKLLQRMALRGLYLLEVNARSVQVSEDERKANDELLEQGMQSNTSQISTEEVKKTFATDKSSLLNLTEEDAQRIVTFGTQFLDEISVSDDEIAQQMTATKAFRDILARQNDATRTLAQDLLKDPASQTDEGFARLAREHSEGIEAKNGGILAYDFSASELAEVNHLSQFELKPGQTSGLLETPSAFRVMRVLSAVPPKEPGAPGRLRVAQWLFKKHPEDEDSRRAEIRAQLLVAKQQRAVVDIGRSLQEKYGVTCVFFPDGLWPDAAE